MIFKFYQQQIFPHLLNQVMQTPALMDLRRELLLGVQDEALEIGFGSGINLAFYQGLNTLYALEPNAEIFKLATSRLAATAFYVEHVAARAEQLPFADDTFQHVVSTWTLCSVQDLTQTLAEIFRVLAPGGRLHIIEHVLNREHLNIQRLQHLLTPIQKRLADGCHFNRDIETALYAAGFEVEALRYVNAQGIPRVAQAMLFARLKKPIQP